MHKIKLTDFLKKGSLIRTKHYENSGWVTNIVYGINQDSIEIDIGLEKNYIENLLMVGDVMRCKYYENDFEYSFDGWVNRIKADFPQSITIRIDDISKFINRRKSVRYDVYVCSVIRVNNEIDKGMFAIMTNISKKGAAFVVQQEFEELMEPVKHDFEKNNVFFDVYISADSQLSFEGKIKRKVVNDKGLEYGIEILRIDAKNEEILENFIAELDKKDKEFYNKGGNF